MLLSELTNKTEQMSGRLVGGENPKLSQGRQVSFVIEVLTLVIIQLSAGVTAFLCLPSRLESRDSGLFGLNF